MGSSPQPRSPEKQDSVLKDKPPPLSQVVTHLLPSRALRGGGGGVPVSPHGRGVRTSFSSTSSLETVPGESWPGLALGKPGGEEGSRQGTYLVSTLPGWGPRQGAAGTLPLPQAEPKKGQEAQLGSRETWQHRKREGEQHAGPRGSPKKSEEVLRH